MSTKKHPRRRCTPQETEGSPLNAPVVRPQHSYATFPRKTLPTAQFRDILKTADIAIHAPRMCSLRHIVSFKLSSRNVWWLLASLIAGAGCLFMILPFLTDRHPVSAITPRHPRFIWDYNAFHPRPSTVSTSNAATSEVTPTSPRNLLLSQITGSLALEELSEIASLPNRAYARQWRQDYVLYSSGSNQLAARDACLDKIHVLNAILDKQESKRWTEQHSAYDAIALFPADAIIIDLDYDLNNLLPMDKLVALAGWKDGSTNMESQTNVVLFNLKHQYTATVAKLWDELTEGISCGASNELQILVHIIAAVAGDGWELLIHGLEESGQGYIGETSRRVIKSIFASVPAPRFATLTSDMAASRKAMQTTASSVCYRYYPMCEVL